MTSGSYGGLEAQLLRNFAHTTFIPENNAVYSSKLDRQPLFPATNPPTVNIITHLPSL